MANLQCTRPGPNYHLCHDRFEGAAPKQRATIPLSQPNRSVRSDIPQRKSVQLIHGSRLNRAVSAMVKKLQKRRRATTTTTAATTQQSFPHREKDRARRSTAPSPELRAQDTKEGRRSTDPNPKAGEETSAGSRNGKDKEVPPFTSKGDQVEKRGTEVRLLRTGEHPRKPSQRLRVFCPDCIRNTHKGQGRTKEQESKQQQQQSHQ